MAATKLILGFFLCLLGTTVLATTRAPRLGSPEFCNLQQLYTSQPNQRLEFEGGSIEHYWNINDEQYQCLGTYPSRMTLQPNSLFLPSFQSYPRLLFIEQGEGIVGIQLPGCAETFDTGVQQQHMQQQQQQQQQQPRRMGERGMDSSADSHQKVHRFREGDIIAIPAGAVYWTYNDRNQEVVAVIVDDVNNFANQLDFQAKTSFLAGGISSEHIQGQQQFQGHQGRQGQQQIHGQQSRQQGRRRSPFGGQEELTRDNVYAGFDTELLAEAFNCDPQIMRALQESRNRGVIVQVHQQMEFVTPEEEEQQQMHQRRSRGGPSNGVEETICSAKLVFNLDNQREADVFNRQAGKLNMVNEHKLPILSLMDLSAEKGHLQPNALFSPHWTVNSHTVVYVLNGDAQIQVVSNNGEAVLNEQVSRGDIFPVPQFFAATARAGQNGFEWVAFKTNRAPLKSPLAGYTSVFRAMPLEVITNSYQVSPSQAQSLKLNRETESLLFSPQRQY
ncbi:putative 11-S seed storage protein, plant [Helianthus debilis subsp. tardiflorus]